MHVAVCDDNVADRRHIERLLSRESDKRAGTPDILYIDSYGDKDHFLVNPLKYNLIFMDMCARPGIVEEIIQKLDQIGFHAPLILYASKIDYAAIPGLPDYVVHAKKPYLPGPLPEYLELGDRDVIGHIVTISVHQDNILTHIPKTSIMYVIQEGCGCRLYLTDDAQIMVDESIIEMAILFEPYEEFERIDARNIVNFSFVDAVMPRSIVMQDGQELKISFLKYGQYRKLRSDIVQFE